MWKDFICTKNLIAIIVIFMASKLILYKNYEIPILSVAKSLSIFVRKIFFEYYIIKKIFLNSYNLKFKI